MKKEIINYENKIKNSEIIIQNVTIIFKIIFFLFI